MTTNLNFDLNEEFENIMNDKKPQGTALAKATGDVVPGEENARGPVKEPSYEESGPAFVQ